MRRLTDFCKLVIFCAVVRFSKNFTLKAPKCRLDNKQQIARQKR